MEKRVSRPGCIALVGLPASGKSSIGAALARRLGLPFVDLDEKIVTEEGRTIAAIFKEDGEAAFRQLESSSLDKATGRGKLVLATGGGCVLTPGNRALLVERCLVVWLDLSPELAAARVKAGGRKAGSRKAGGRNAETSGSGTSKVAGDQTMDQTVDQISRESAVRPLLADGDVLDRMRTLDAVRRPLYRDCASIIIQVEGKTPAAIVEELYAALD
jgi:shikimate kinase